MDYTDDLCRWSFSAETTGLLPTASTVYADALTWALLTAGCPTWHFVVGDQSIDTWKAFEDLSGGYARSPDNWQVRCNRESTLLLLSETFDLGVTSAQLSLALDAGTYNAESSGVFGSFEGFKANHEK